MRYQVEKASRQGLERAIAWAAREGWNPGLHDVDCFWAIDPNGFFQGTLDGEVVGVASALIYDARFAFCGFYIVAPEHRAKGFGLQITRARLDYVGERNVGLDGVVDMADKYARLGYRPAHRSTRFAFTPNETFEADPAIVPVSAVDFEALAGYDQRHFFARRESFLKCWISRPQTTALALLDGGALAGYGVIRKCITGHKIGPLFASDPQAAEALFRALCHQGRGGPVFLDVPEPNAAAMRWVKRYGMAPAFSCVRMYLRGDPGLPLEAIYGITTFEAG